MLIPVYITLRVIDFGVPQVQGIFQQPVGIGAGGAEGGIDQRIVYIPAFARYIPRAGHIGIGDGNNSPRHIPGRVERLLHEFLDIFRLDPGCAKAHLNFRRIQVFGLYPFQIGHIDGKFRVILCKLAATASFSRTLPERYSSDISHWSVSGFLKITPASSSVISSSVSLPTAP